MSRSLVSRRKTDIIRHLRTQLQAENQISYKTQNGTQKRHPRQTRWSFDRWFKYLIGGNLK